ncbi:MAG: glycosyltransferase [bacterium]|jgi:glycosyltransferase involved in cell wall biosynthesis
MVEGELVYTAYADLGSTYGGGPQSTFIWRALLDEGLLAQAYFRMVKGEGPFQKTSGIYPFGQFGGKIVGVASELFGYSSRFVNEMIFDFFVARVLRKKERKILLTSAIMPKSANIVKENGGKIIFIAKNSLGYATIVEEESKYWDYPIKPAQLVYGREYDKWVLDIPDLVLTLAHKDVDFLKSKGINAVHILNGVNSKRFAFNAMKKSTDCPTFLFLGAEPLRKGLFYLLSAWKMAGEPGRLVVGGVGSQMRKIKKYIHYKLGNFKRLELYPYLDSLSAYYNADAFVFPTLAEGMPRVVLEAASCGLPVITTDIGSGGIINHLKTGYIVMKRDIAGLAKAILYLADNANVRRELGLSARLIIDSVQYNNFAKQIADNVKEFMNFA